MSQAIRTYESVAALGVSETMSVTDQCPTSGHWWWLPQCDLVKATDPRYWQLRRIYEHDEQCYVGLFMGPVTMPANWADRVATFQQHLQEQA